jgi:hypothetical protein
MLRTIKAIPFISVLVHFFQVGKALVRRETHWVDGHLQKKGKKKGQDLISVIRPALLTFIFFNI